MSTKIPVPILTKGKRFDLFKQELDGWKEVADLEATKQGIAVALLLPEDDDFSLKSKLFDKYSIADLKKATGLKTVTDFLDAQLGKDDLADSFCKYGEFEGYRRSTESIVEYIGKFEQLYNTVEKKGIKLPSEILAYKLLRGANLLQDEMLLVISGVDY